MPVVLTRSDLAQDSAKPSQQHPLLAPWGYFDADSWMCNMAALMARIISVCEPQDPAAV